MTDGLEVRDELLAVLGVWDKAESWRKSVLEGTEVVICRLVVAPMLCNTFDDTRVTVIGAGLKKINYQS